MKSINKFLGITSLILTILLILSITVGAIYSFSYRPIIKDFINLDYSNYNFPNPNYKWSFGPLKNSSSYDTITISESKTFNTCNNIVINASIEDIIFIPEPRDNIEIEYYAEKPNTPLYSVEYNITNNDDTIFVNSAYELKNIFSDISYENYIKIHVPEDYWFETLDLTMSMGEINNNSILDQVDNLSLTADMGNIDVQINEPKKSLTLNCDMGNIDLESNSKIDDFTVSCSFGDISLNINDFVNLLWCSADMGSVDINTTESINNVNLNANLGNIKCTFNEKIDTLSASTDMGNINCTFYNNSNSTAYADTDLGSIKCDFPIVKKEDNPNFNFYSNLGTINAKSK